MKKTRKLDKTWEEDELSRYKDELPFGYFAGARIFSAKEALKYCFNPELPFGSWPIGEVYQAPGPGYYSYELEATKKRTTSAHISKPKARKNLSVDVNNPFEPGKYDVDKGFGAGAKVRTI